VHGDKRRRSGKKRIQMKKKNKVLLVGWDAADWKMIDKLMAAGLMPAMKKVVDNGIRGRFATLDPPLSPMLWTSMATGVRPFRHGVLGFVEHDGAGGLRPVSSHSRKVPAFWNMLTKEGLKSNVVGWWPSNPVESINGVMVSNLFQQEKKSGEVIALEDWKMEPGTVYPESMAESLAELRVHPAEITGNLVMPFVPQAVELDKKQDKRLTVISKFLAHSASLHAACTELMETTEWDLTAVYHDALDHFSHAFMKYNPPKMEGLDDEPYELFKDVVKGAYVYHDMMLGRLLDLIDDDTTVAICSDHGFHSDHLRPRFVPQVPSGPAVEHAPYGVFAAMGPGIKKGETIHGARILDLTPTLLTLFDLPVGRDMDGKPLTQIYDHPKEVKYIDSWENDDRFGGEIVVADAPSDSANEAALQQLIDLGYIDDINVPDGDGASDIMRKKLKETMRENNFYLAKSYASANKFEEALELLLEIENREKPDFRYLLEIVGAATKTKRFALAEEYIQFIRANELMTARFLDVLEAQVQIGLNEPGKALVLLERALEDFPESPNVMIDLGKLLNTLRQTDKAKEIFRKVIELDPDNVFAYNGYGIACLRNEEYEDAIEHFLMAIERLYHFPVAHLHLGEALALINEYELAKRSFEVVEAIAPTMKKTYRWLYDLNVITGDDDKAAHYKKVIDQFSKGERVILTGPPGAKLKNTIQKFVDSGISVDGDPDDIFGEEVNVTTKGWLEERNSDILYLPLNLLGSLPMSYSYRIVYVNDELEEVMDELNRMSRLRDASFNKELLDSLTHQQRSARIWIDQQPTLDIIYVNEVEEVDGDLIQHFVVQKQVD